MSDDIAREITKLIGSVDAIMNKGAEEREKWAPVYDSLLNALEKVNNLGE